MCKPLWKKRLMAVLVLGFVIQGSLVYTDSRSAPLSAVALEGRRLWQQLGCQTCHQLYGQGGFLGPDLTNVASRADSMRIASLLTVGSGQMPALGLEEGEIAALRAFLAEMDRPEVGRGQLRLGSDAESAGVQAAFETAIDATLGDVDSVTRVDARRGVVPAEVGAGARLGFEIVRSRPCAACHYPFRRSPVGAPDLSTVATRLTPDALDLILTSGRPEKRMPPPIPPLTVEERASIIEYFAFLSDRRVELMRRTDELEAERRFEWGRLPSWEYRR